MSGNERVRLENLSIADGQVFCIEKVLPKVLRQGVLCFSGMSA